MLSVLQGLFNPELGPVDILFIVINMTGALFALYWNVKAGKNGPLGEVRYVVAGLALLYFLAYAVLIFTHIVPIWWTHTLRGLNILTWFYVWILPAKDGMKLSQEVGYKLEQEVLDQIGISKRD